MRQAASARIAGLRARGIIASAPSRFLIAAVAIVVRGHKALTAIFPRNSPASPRTTRLMPNFAIEYAVCGANHFSAISRGGDNMSMCGFAERIRYGVAHLDTMKLPRVYSC